MEAPLGLPAAPMAPPPNAGPVSSPTAANPTTPSSAAPVRVRSNFPETWIWQMVEAG